MGLLLESGFTRTQAKLYLCLAKLGLTDVKALSKQTDVPRQEIYRALNELQEKGYVEKIISSPLKYKAISIKELLTFIVNAKTDEYNRTLERTISFIDKIEEEEPEPESQQDYRIAIIEGKETIIKKCKLAHINARNMVLSVSTFQMCMQVAEEMYEIIVEALHRGLQYKIIIERGNDNKRLSKEIKNLLDNENFQVKIASDKLTSNSSVFDSKVVTFNFYPSKPITESPMVWTNHPSIVAGFESQFWHQWNKSPMLIYKKQ